MIAFPQQVTFMTATAALPAVLAAVHAGERDFDLSGCASFDSSLLGVCLDLQRQAAGGGCRFHNPPANLRKLAALYGVDPLLFGTPA